MLLLLALNILLLLLFGQFRILFWLSNYIYSYLVGIIVL
jgi:hypothetical protein